MLAHLVLRDAAKEQLMGLKEELNTIFWEPGAVSGVWLSTSMDVTAVALCGQLPGLTRKEKRSMNGFGGV